MKANFYFLPTHTLCVQKFRAGSAFLVSFHTRCKHPRDESRRNFKANLVASVVDLAEEVLGLIGITVLLKPEGEDGEVTNEEDGKDTEVVNAEPFVGALGGDSGGGGEDGGHEAGGGSHGALGEGGHGGLLGNGNCVWE